MVTGLNPSTPVDEFVGIRQNEFASPEAIFLDCTPARGARDISVCGQEPPYRVHWSGHWHSRWLAASHVPSQSVYHPCSTLGPLIHQVQEALDGCRDVLGYSLTSVIR